MEFSRGAWVLSYEHGHRFSAHCLDGSDVLVGPNGVPDIGSALSSGCRNLDKGVGPNGLAATSERVAEVGRLHLLGHLGEEAS